MLPAQHQRMNCAGLTPRASTNLRRLPTVRRWILASQAAVHGHPFRLSGGHVLNLPRRTEPLASRRRRALSTSGAGKLQQAAEFIWL